MRNWHTPGTVLAKHDLLRFQLRRVRSQRASKNLNPKQKVQSRHPKKKSNPKGSLIKSNPRVYQLRKLRSYLTLLKLKVSLDDISSGINRPDQYAPVRVRLHLAKATRIRRPSKVGKRLLKGVHMYFIFNHCCFWTFIWWRLKIFVIDLRYNLSSTDKTFGAVPKLLISHCQ